MSDEWGTCEERWAARQRKRDGIWNGLERYKLLDRARVYNNGGVVVIDESIWYYCQSKKARVKGSTRYIRLRGFAHFVEYFGLATK